MQGSAAITRRRALRSRARVRRALGEGGRATGAASTHVQESLLRARGHVSDARHLRCAQDLRRRCAADYGSPCRGATSAARRFSMQHPPHACARTVLGIPSAGAHKRASGTAASLPRGRRVPARPRMAPASLRRPTVTHQGEELKRVLNGTLATSWRANLRHQPYSYSAASLAQVKDQPARSGQCAIATYGAQPPRTHWSRGMRGAGRPFTRNARSLARRRADAYARALQEAPLTRHCVSLMGRCSMRGFVSGGAHTMSQRRMLR